MDHLNPDRNPRRPLRLLSLDGGGVRGLSSLLVLEELMYKISDEEKKLGRRSQDDIDPLKPCDYFDLIGGTSTGGIIAILLGRLRLDCKQCIQIYTDLAKEIFYRDRVIHFGGAKIPTGSTRFSGQVLERAIKAALVKLGFDPDEPMWDDSLFEELDMREEQRDSIWGDIPHTFSDSPQELRHGAKGALASASSSVTHLGESGFTALAKVDNDYGTMSQPFASDSAGNARHHVRRQTWRLCPRGSVHQKADKQGCRAFVVTSLKNGLGVPRILATYDPNDRMTTIWQALRATSAAPTFFEEITFGSPRMTYLDGAVGCNNPSLEVDYAAKSIWEGRPIGVIVSVGTGLQTIPSVKKMKMTRWLPFGLGTDIEIARALVSMSTSTSYVDNQMERMYFDTDTKYYRFDVDSGLANISLEEWMREDEIAGFTRLYMRDPLQMRRAKKLAGLMSKLGNLPPRFEIRAQKFRVGVTGRGIIDGEFQHEELDFKTGFPVGFRPTREDLSQISALRSTSPTGREGLQLDVHTGKTRKIFPVAQDLDGDGKDEETVVTTCLRSENVCLRCLRTGIPPGKYRVRFILCFFATEHTAPTELIFSVGKPYDVKTFDHRFIDVKITTDIVPVLLHPDAVRIRVGKRRLEEIKGKGWVEMEGDVPVDVGLDGALGLMITKKFVEGEWVGGWSFGGVRLEPVFGS